jgi:hypothetical protein
LQDGGAQYPELLQEPVQFEPPPPVPPPTQYGFWFSGVPAWSLEL